MNTLQAILQRQSCRSFTSEKITKEALEVILTAANAAPVGMGKYEDMRLTVIQNISLLSKIDRSAANMMGNPDYHPLGGASTIVVVSARKQEDPRFLTIPHCNAGCIMENMMLAATDQGLGSVYLMAAAVALGNNEALCRELRIPDNFTPIAILPVGKPTNPPNDRKASLLKIPTEHID